jgi:3,4-dihydroxy 2-butanone 4-phosphate synthase / GTP cyclohydrolase II
MHISSIEEILNDFKTGQFVILIDDLDRENEGDLMFAAQFADSQKINFMSREARGLICLTLTPRHVEQLQLPLQKSEKHSSGGHHHAAFTFSIEASQGITTGISAHERAHTILTAIKSDVTPNDIVCPGHIFPLRARAGGVLERAGHTEASVDLAQLCHLNAAGVLCEVLDDEGAAAKGEYLKKFSEKFKIKIGTVADLIRYRKAHPVVA